jgi:glutamine amidotransferase PdxT
MNEKTLLVGVLAIQGGVEEHMEAIKQAGASAREVDYS